MRRYMAGLKQSGAFTIEAAEIARMRSEFDAGRADMAEVAATIRSTLAASNYLLDPHTAAPCMWRRARRPAPCRWWCWHTAHPAKFPGRRRSRQVACRPHCPRG